MKWKQLIVEKIERDMFMDSLNTIDKTMEYIHDYFKGFFDLKSDYIKLEKTTDRITFEVYDKKIHVIKSSEVNIKFKHYISNGDYMETIGQLYTPEMRFTYSSSFKTEEFSNDLLNKLLETVFGGLAKK